MSDQTTISLVGPKVARHIPWLGRAFFLMEIWWKTRHMSPLHRNATLGRAVEAANDYFEHEAWREQYNEDRVAKGKKPL